MGSCMSTPSAEPKQTPVSTKQNPPSSANTTPANADNGNANPSTPTTAPNSASTPQSNDRSSLGASGGNHDRGSDAQAISAALAATEGSIEKRGSKDRSNAIDRQLEDDQRKFKKECKILLLGRFWSFVLDPDVSLDVSRYLVIQRPILLDITYISTTQMYEALTMQVPVNPESLPSSSR
jgi:hypothetical protein